MKLENLIMTDEQLIYQFTKQIVEAENEQRKLQTRIEWLQAERLKLINKPDLPISEKDSK